MTSVIVIITVGFVHYIIAYGTYSCYHWTAWATNIHCSRLLLLLLLSLLH